MIAQRLAAAVSSYSRSCENVGRASWQLKESKMNLKLRPGTKEDAAAEALRLGGQYATNYYRFFASLDRLGSRSILPQHFSRVSAEELDAANLVLLGDPDDLVTRIGEIRNFYGIDFLLMEIAQGGAPNAEVVRAMELFARHVIPKFRPAGEP
jgi:hypothetical protein